MKLTTNDRVDDLIGVYSYAEGANPSSHPFIIARIGNYSGPEEGDRSRYGTILVGTYPLEIGEGGGAAFCVHDVVPLYDTPVVIRSSKSLGPAEYQSPNGFAQWGLFLVPRRTRFDFVVDYFDSISG